ncbi:glycerophosphodiester phosphodiesterase family protein [Vibrio salinus]|uniref:glycerophosphodiester phosphodiesterase family protein n=1 Tax=Vibrio salinus TaxID=2899784 RepID=UPI001E4CA394|nr:glycerophosphodiester phosphodiesterase family protein [Vibrio salinus]MCE0495164.1 glycerophosphodiester phosphodiesterase family protein [Vibrio salinus]
MELTTKTLDFSRNNPDVLIIAHRGIWHQAPENSLAAVEASIQAGAQIVEIDTQLCATGEFVVIHDATLDRTTTGSGLVAETSLEEIQQLYLYESDGASQVVSQQRVSLLSEVLELARGRIIVNVDAKFPAQLPAIVDAIEQLEMLDQVIVKSKFIPDEQAVTPELAQLCRKVMHIPLVHAPKGKIEPLMRALSDLQPKMIEFSFEDLEEFRAAKPLLQQLDYRIWLNTLDPVNVLGFADGKALRDPEAIWGTLIDAGVGALQTDYPEQLGQWLIERDNDNPLSSGQ